MRRIVFIFALAAFAANAAGVSSARFGDIGLYDSVVTNVTLEGFLTEHQDISGKADKANTYTKSETDAKIVELAPAPGDYESVSNRAMNAVQPSELFSVAESSSNYTDSAIAAFTPAPAGRSWNRPAEWSLSYAPVLDDSTTVGVVSFETNDVHMVFSNYTQRTMRSFTVRVWPENLDRYSKSSPLPVALSVSGGGTVAADVVTVPSNGIYGVRGVNSAGEVREIPVPFAAGVVQERTESAYAADEDGTPRRLANDFSASVLSAMEDGGTAKYIGETNTFRVWRTVRPTFAWPGVGNVSPFAVSPHVMATAQHYSKGQIWIENAAWTNWVDGGMFTIRLGEIVDLNEWAATNGFTAAEIAAAGDLSDVRMIHLSEGEIPTNCCPWFASPEWMDAHYGDIKAMCAWTITQGNHWHKTGNALQWAIPVVMHGGSLTAANTWMAAGGIRPGGVMPRADIAALVGAYNDREWPDVRGGDSGKPIWISDFSFGSRRDILVSHFHYVGSGPNYFAALPIIRAYCAQFGDTLKEME